MKKTVEIEYVGIEDVQEIMDDCYALMGAGHYVGIEMSNVVNPRVIVYIYLDGWEAGKEADYKFNFTMSEDKNDIDEMNRCKFCLKNLIVEVDD